MGYNFMGNGNDDRAINFTTFKNDKLYLNPSIYDNGLYQFFFFTRDSEQRNFLQSVVVSVLGGDTNRNLKAYLTSISRNGLVNI
jgi:hypothetical protein